MKILVLFSLALYLACESPNMIGNEKAISGRWANMTEIMVAPGDPVNDTLRFFEGDKFGRRGAKYNGCPYGETTQPSGCDFWYSELLMDSGTYKIQNDTISVAGEHSNLDFLAKTFLIVNSDSIVSIGISPSVTYTRVD